MWSDSGDREGGWAGPLRWTSARTVYNVVDVAWPAHLVGAAERFSQALRHAGPAAARGAWAALVWLDWAPVLRGQGARFWRLDANRRSDAVARWRGSRVGFRRRAWERLEAAALQSSSGA